MPRCRGTDPSKTTAVRYERDRPRELMHMDVNKVGRVPTGRVAGYSRAASLAQKVGTPDRA